MADLGGYAGKILRIDLTKREAKTVDLDRSLASQFLDARACVPSLGERVNESGR